MGLDFDPNATPSSHLPGVTGRRNRKVNGGDDKEPGVTSNGNGDGDGDTPVPTTTTVPGEDLEPPVTFSWSWYTELSLTPPPPPPPIIIKNDPTPSDPNTGGNNGGSGGNNSGGSWSFGGQHGYWYSTNNPDGTSSYGGGINFGDHWYQGGGYTTSNGLSGDSKLPGGGTAWVTFGYRF